MGYLEMKSELVRADREANIPGEDSMQRLREKAAGRPIPPSLRERVDEGDTIGLIAEFKRRSPSAGAIAAGEDPVAAAGLFKDEGASALSILTDLPDFGGSLADLEEVATATDLPVLRKDFLVDTASLLEARAAGASAALLIVRILEAGIVAHLISEGREIGLDCLVEVHDEAELEIAVLAGADLVGVNNRDLDTLTTDLTVTERLAPMVPASVTLVSESGICSVDDVKRVRDAGARAVLVGESLLRLPPADRRLLVRQLARIPR